MQPVEILSDRPGLVRLQSADEVPDDGIFYILDLRQRFLDVIFAKMRKSRGLGLPDGRDGFFLGHGQECDGVLISVCGPGGGPDPAL